MQASAATGPLRFADWYALDDAARVRADEKVGNAHHMVDRSLRLGLYATLPLRSDIEKAIRGAGNYADALDLTEAAINAHTLDDAISASVTVPAILTDLAGRLMVAEGTQRVTLARGDDELVQFLSMPYEEAIEAFKRRVPAQARELETLLAGYRVRGVQARAMMLETLRERIREHIVTSMTEGTGFRAFQADVDETLNTLGITPASPSYLETVYRTNIQGAYGAGRWQAMNDPDVVEALPLWEYRAVGDGRTRDSHMALDGLVFEKGNPATDILAPPGGFNCRCSAVSISDAGGRQVLRAPPPGVMPDPGFERAPGLWIPPA